MNTDDLIHRVNRIYSSLDTAEETDMSQLTPKIVSNGKRIGIYQDFTGGLNDEELSNLVHSLIHNIANLHDNLKRWAKKNGKDKSKVDIAFKNSLALQIIQDLSNNDKHGYPPRDGGKSGKLPKIGNITRTMQLTTNPQKGSFVTMTLNSQGKPQVSGSGQAKVIISADILDKDNNIIGNFRQIALESIETWEHLLADFGVSSID